MKWVILYLLLGWITGRWLLCLLVLLVGVVLEAVFE